MQRRPLLATLGGATLAGAAGWPRPRARAQVAMPRFAYVGCYTRNAPGGSSGRVKATGISVMAVEPGTGALSLLGSAPSDNPSFLALHPNGQVLYAINEIRDFEGRETGSIEAWRVDERSGALELINREPLSGPIPAHLAVTPDGGHVVVALYVGAAFDVLPLDAAGRLGKVAHSLRQTGSGPHPRQTAPHPHAVTVDPGGRFIATADLGIDKVEILRLTGSALERVDARDVPPGSGPRHVAFHPNGRLLYVINELTATVIGWRFDPASGRVGDEVTRVSTVPDGFPEHRSTAEIMVHPAGRLLLGSNRRFADHPLADSVAVFRLDPATGALTPAGHVTEGVAFPRAFTMDPAGRWLYVLNQKGDTIVQHAIDEAAAKLSPTGRVTEVAVPVSLVWKA
jgi:6-phosphogluconolactonase (cycloisomerase 2 family)